MGGRTRARADGAEVAAEMVATESLKPWDRNPRKNEEAIGPVAESIRRFGFAAPIVARKADRRIVAGHTRWEAARRLGLQTVPVRFVDLSETEASAYALADNRLGELADWDDEGLSAIVKSLSELEVDLSGLGWDEKELDEIIKGAESGRRGGDPGAPPVHPVAVSNRGEVYDLGPHRLACGDSKDPEVWRLLMGQDRAQIVWTDPPYGVAYKGGASAEMSGKARVAIENDDLDVPQLTDFLRVALGNVAKHCRNGAAWYVAAPSGPAPHAFSTVLTEMKIWRQTLAWVKDRFVLSRSDYHGRHEIIYYGWTPGAAHYFVDDRTLDSVFEIKRPQVSDEHPTMKPIELVARCLLNSSKPGWIVAEPFGGSGTTLIAAAMEGRVARVVELSPHYCDVIRRRWTRFAVEAGIDPGPGALEEVEAA